MESLLIIIGVIAWVVRMSGKVNKNKPGQAQPQRSVSAPPAAPARRDVPEAPQPMTTLATPDAQQSDFWRSVGQTMKEAAEAANELINETEISDAAQENTWMPDANDLSGDDHRVCLHDESEDLSGDDAVVCMHDTLEGVSMGGSLAPTAEQGGHVTPSSASKSGRFEETRALPVTALPAMTAREMRQAVVMAEILKRPAERRVEQARRWATR